MKKLKRRVKKTKAWRLYMKFTQKVDSLLPPVKDPWIEAHALRAKEARLAGGTE